VVGHRGRQFAAGELDFDTSESIKHAAIAAVVSGENKYTDALGLPELRIASFVRDRR
jgi:aspartate aminotransferase